MRRPPSGLLAEGAPELTPRPGLGHARELLAGWRAPDAERERLRLQTLAFLAEHPEDGHRRSCPAGHLVASGLVLDAAGGRFLLALHRKLGRWLQLGGHCDGDANLAAVALRECREESGLDGLAVDPVPVDLDVHLSLIHI